MKTKTCKTVLYIDMDGTIADLYGTENWLPRLRAEDTTIFEECEPMTTQERLFELFPNDKYDIRVLSMTPKGATQGYCQNVINQKNNWLNKYFPQIKKRIYLPYGNNKNLKNSKSAILIDDNKTIRENYKGLALEPNWS